MLPLPSDNPLVIVAQVIGYIIALPVAALVIRAIFFVGQTWKLFADLVKEVKQIRRELDARNVEAQGIAWSFAVVEEDINELQKHAGLEQRDYPDRRVGPADRRAS